MSGKDPKISQSRSTQSFPMLTERAKNMLLNKSKDKENSDDSQKSSEENIGKLDENIEVKNKGKSSKNKNNEYSQIKKLTIGKCRSTIMSQIKALKAHREYVSNITELIQSIDDQEINDKVNEFKNTLDNDLSDILNKKKIKKKLEVKLKENSDEEVDENENEDRKININQTLFIAEETDFENEEYDDEDYNDKFLSSSRVAGKINYAESVAANKHLRGIPIFGENDKLNVVDWLFLVEDIMLGANIAEDNKIRTVLPFLRGFAFQLVKKYKKADADLKKWKEFKADLIAMYQSGNFKIEQRVKINNLKHRDQPFNEYARDFLTIVNDLETMGDEEALSCFIQGLKPKTKVDVLNANPANLTEAIRIATNYESNRQPLNIRQVNSANFKDLTCYKCKKMGHTANVCRSKGYSANKPFQKSSFRPNFKTNFSKPTFRKPNFIKKFTSKFTNNKGGSGNNNSNVVCHHCKKKGHFASNCYKKGKSNNVQVIEDKDTESVCILETINYNNNNNNGKLMVVKGLVNGIKLDIGIDSGATVSIMGKDTAKKHNFRMLFSDCKIKTANNAVRSVDGVTERLIVSIYGRECKMEFIIIDHKDHDILLGLDWFRLTGAGIFPSINLIRFPDEDVIVNRRRVYNNHFTEDKYASICLAEVGDDPDLSTEIDWDSKKKEIKTNIILGEKENKNFMNLVTEFKLLFAYNITDLDACSVREHQIITNTDDPVYIPPYRKSEKERQEIKEQIDEMIKAKVVRKSKSPWSAPVILIPKPNGTKRMCIDYRRLNAITVQQNWPLPRILDILDRLNGSTIFTAIDLKSGYWQVKMHQNSY